MAAVATPADAAEEARNSQYVRATLESEIIQQKGMVRKLTDQIDSLRSERTKFTTDTHEFVSYATSELKHKDEIIDELRAKMAETAVEHETELKRLRMQIEQSLTVAMADRRAAEAAMREQMKGLEDKLERARQYLERRDEVELRIEELQVTLDTEREAHAASLQELERKYLMEKATLMRQHKAQYAELRSKARAEVLRSLDSEQAKLVAEHREMKTAIALQEEERMILDKERAAAVAHARSLSRDVDIFSEKEREWARQANARSVENKALASRVRDLEQKVASERAEKEMLKATLTSAHGKETEDMRLELEGLRALMRLKNRELKTIKRLAAIVLQQRTEVEQFFLDALLEVKTEIARRRKAAAMASSLAAKTPLEQAGVGVAYSTGTGRAGGGGAATARAAAASAAVAAAKGAAAAGASVGTSRLGKGATATPGGTGGTLPTLANTPLRLPLGAAATMTLTVPAHASTIVPSAATATTLPTLALRSVQGLASAHPAAGSASDGLGVTATPLRAVATQVEAGVYGGGTMRASGRLAGGTGRPAGTVDLASSVASVGGGAGGVDITRAEARAVDISELSPEDREQVLRLLFARINGMGHRSRAQPQAAAPAAPAGVLPHFMMSGLGSSVNTVGSSSSSQEYVDEAHIMVGAPAAPPPAAPPAAAARVPVLRDPPARRAVAAPAAPSPTGGHDTIDLQGPFGLSADLPPALQEMQYKRPLSGGARASATSPAASEPAVKPRGTSPMTSTAAPLLAVVEQPSGGVASPMGITSSPLSSVHRGGIADIATGGRPAPGGRAGLAGGLRYSSTGSVMYGALTDDSADLRGSSDLDSFVVNRAAAAEGVIGLDEDDDEDDDDDSEDGAGGGEVPASSPAWHREGSIRVSNTRSSSAGSMTKAGDGDTVALAAALAEKAQERAALRKQLHGS